jgi:hypothetical protein
MTSMRSGLPVGAIAIGPNGISVLRGGGTGREILTVVERCQNSLKYDIRMAIGRNPLFEWLPGSHAL